MQFLAWYCNNVWVQHKQSLSKDVGAILRCNCKVAYWLALGQSVVQLALSWARRDKAATPPEAPERRRRRRLPTGESWGKKAYDKQGPPCMLWRGVVGRVQSTAAAPAHDAVTQKNKRGTKA